MKKVLCGIGIVAVVTLSGCAALTSTKDRSSTAQSHDARMRMRHGQLIDKAGNNYGTVANMEANHPSTSVPSVQNTTAQSQTIRTGNAGNAAHVNMPDAPTNPQPNETSGNIPR